MYILECIEDKTLNKYQILMALCYHKLDSKRVDKEGIGIAVVIQYYDGEYGIITVDGRACSDKVYEYGDNAKYIYETISKYPEDVALTHGFTKYRQTDINEYLQTLVDAYNLIQEMDEAVSTYFEIWDSMNKTEFNKWLKQQK